MKAVLFDLDDTLYPEMEFVKSGFRAVSQYLASRHHLHEDVLFTQMLDILQRDGRGRVFDSLLHSLGLYSEEKVKLLVYLYRTHRPTIHLYEDALPTLALLKDRGMRVGILTDGMASVQRRKIAALGLEKVFDVIVCTDELGSDCQKPSTIPYRVALDLLQVAPLDAAYVGNNPAKDFSGAASIGMLTIEVKRQKEPNYTSCETGEHAGAESVVENLNEILAIVGEEENAR